MKINVNDIPQPKPPRTFDLTELSEADVQTIQNGLMSLEWAPHNPNAERLYIAITDATSIRANDTNEDGTWPVARI